MFDDYVQIGNARDSSAYIFYVDGKSHLKGDARITGNLLMTNGGSSIYWDNGTYHQRILNTNDSDGNTAVFNFQQSESNGSSWKNLLEIRDNGRLILTNKTGGIYRVDEAATSEPLIHLSNNSVDSSILRIDGNNRTSVVDTKTYGFDLKYIGTGSGEANSLDLIADNRNGTDVTAISVSNTGKVGIGDKYDTTYRFYVNGNSYLKGNTFLYGDLSALYDNTDQYLQYTAKGTVANHAAKISLSRIIASGTASTPGTKIIGVQLDAATGLLHLQAASSDPSATAGARIKFTFWNSESNQGQPVYISHSVNDSYRGPYGLKIWGSNGAPPGAWLEVEGNLYIGSASNANSDDNSALYIRGKSAIEGHDDWLRLNDNSSFDYGTFSPKLIRSDEALQVGENGTNFYANNSGNGYIQNTFGVHGTDTTKCFFVNGTSRFADNIIMDSGSKILFSTNAQYIRWAGDETVNNNTGRSWYGIGRYENASDSNYSWLNISNRWGINITTRGATFLRHNDNIIPTINNQIGTVGSGTNPIYSNGGVLTASSSTVGSATKGTYLNAGTITAMTYELKATINTGTANRLAYYNEANAISGGANLYTDGSVLGINATTTTVNSTTYKLYVNGTSYFNGVTTVAGTLAPEATRTRSLGTSSLFWNSPFLFAGGQIHLGNLTANAVGGAVWETTDTTLGWSAFNRYGGGGYGNKLYGISAESVTLEYTTDNGSTWIVDTTRTDDNKRAMFCEQGFSFPVGGLASIDAGPGKVAADAVGYGCRVTVDFTVDNRTCTLSQLQTYWRLYNDKCLCTIEAYDAYANTWTTLTSFTATNSDQRRQTYLASNLRVDGARVDRSASIHKLRWTIITQTKGTTSYNRYAPAINSIVGYGPGGVDISTGSVTPSGGVATVFKHATRLAYDMSRYNTPIEIANKGYDTGGIGAARIGCDLYIGDDMRYTAANTEKWSTLYIGNTANVNAENTHSQGRIYLYSAATQAHIIYGTSTTTAYSHYFPNKTGWIAIGGNGTSTGVGSATQPVYLSAAGVLTACDKISEEYVLKTGDTMTGDLTAPNISVNQCLKVNALSENGIISGYGKLWYDGSDKKLWVFSDTGNDAIFQASKVYGAVWNDYAEYRITNKVKPGQCVIETGLGDLVQSTERLQPGANIVSDTFGFAIGETEQTKTPLAVSGRVLAYPNEDRYSYSAGDAVCSGPNGTISKMTREEIREYPDRIVGTVSEIPGYETWGTGNVKVDGRIWIKVR